MNPEERGKITRLSILHSASSTFVTKFQDRFMTPFVVALGATAFELGLLKALSQFFATVLQLLSSRAVDFFQNRKIIVIAADLVQAAFWIPLIFVALWYHNITFLIVITIFITILEAFWIPPWSSWMGDLISENERGIFFGKYARVGQIVTFLTTVLAFFIIEHFEKAGNVLVGFALLLGFVAVADIFSSVMILFTYEPKYVYQKEHYFSLWQFLKRSPKNNFGRFTWFTFFLYFGLFIGGPFLSFHLIVNMGYTFAEVTALIVISTLVSVFSSVYWGSHADKFGNKTILFATGILQAVKPLLWMIPGPFWYFAVVFAINGFPDPGIELAASNYIYDAVTPQKRARVVAYWNFLKGIAAVLGALLGGYLASSLPTFWIFAFPAQSLFLLSAVIRTIPLFVFYPLIREVRIQEPKKGVNVLLQLSTLEPANMVFSTILLSVKRTRSRVGSTVKNVGDHIRKKKE